TDGAPTDGAPTDGAPTDGAPTDGAPTDGAPTDGVLAEGVLAEGVFAEGAPDLAEAAAVAPASDAVQPEAEQLTADGQIDGAATELDPASPPAVDAAARPETGPVGAEDAIDATEAAAIQADTAQEAEAHTEPAPELTVAKREDGAEPSVSEPDAVAPEGGAPPATDASDLAPGDSAAPDAAQPSTAPIAPLPEEAGAAAETGSETATESPDDADDPAAPTELEVFYRFRWVPQRRGAARPRTDRGRREGAGGPGASDANRTQAADDGSTGDQQRRPGGGRRRGKGRASQPPGGGPGAAPQARSDQGDRTGSDAAGKGQHTRHRSEEARGSGPRREDAGSGGGKRDKQRNKGGRPRDGGKPGDRKPGDKAGLRTYTAAPPGKTDKARKPEVDPDNPFAALLALKQPPE
ncbi:MAG: hypothetical protein AAGD12_03895, partial [Pseudomonadota bacterium]